MRTAIRQLGWLFLFSGSLKSLKASSNKQKDGLPSLVVRPQLLFRRSIQNIKELNKYKFP